MTNYSFFHKTETIFLSQVVVKVSSKYFDRIPLNCLLFFLLSILLLLK